jgi:hypothetical protein
MFIKSPSLRFRAFQFLLTALCAMPLLCGPVLAQGFFLARHFNGQAWRSSPNDRLSMLADLKRKYNLIGMDRHELVELLGEPDGMSFQLLTFSDGEWKHVLQLHFRADGQNDGLITDATDFTGSKTGKKVPMETVAPLFVKVGSAGVSAMSMDEVEQAALCPYEHVGSFSYRLKRSWTGSTDWLDIDLKDDHIKSFKVTHYGPNHC